MFLIKRNLNNMSSSERRSEILKKLCMRKHDTVANLAFEFQVSERTIRRDIEALSLEAPIYTQTGRYGGGVYILDDYKRNTTKRLTEEQAATLVKAVNYLRNNLPREISDRDLDVLDAIVA